MKIVMIHGQNHEGSTCMAARELAAKVGGETEEFFLPRDFDAHCMGVLCLLSDRSDTLPALSETGTTDERHVGSRSDCAGQSRLRISCHGTDDEFPGSFRNMVDGSQADAGNEPETGCSDQYCSRRRDEKHHEGYGRQPGNVGDS